MEEDNKNEVVLPSEEEKQEVVQEQEPKLNSEEPQEDAPLPSEEGQEKQEDSEEKKEESKEEEKEEPKDEGDWTQKYKDELLESGSISDDSIKEIVEKHNLPEALVKEYIELSKTQIESARAKAEEEVLSTVGGRESYTEMLQWATENLSKEEIASFDKQVTKDVDSAKMAVAWLKSKYVDGGNAATLIEGKATTIKLGYKNKSDYLADIGDPRYLHDNAYRAKVNKKLDQSDLSILK